MYIAVDIGGTKTLVAIFNDDGECLRSQKHKTETNFERFMAQLIREIEAVAAEDRIDAIAVAAPALIDYDQGIAKSFGNLDWQNVDITSPLKQTFTDKVLLDNDANFGALGEANLGAGVGHETVLYITLSTGIGTGATFQGKLTPILRRSEGGMMQFPHDGKLTVWEKFASGKAFFEEYGLYGADDDKPEDWKAWAEDVALGLVEMMAIIQPNIIVIGGSMGVHIHKYHDFLQAAVQRNRGRTVDMPVIIGAKFPDTAVINGCYVACKQNFQISNL